jgi:hypothetical protein
MYDLKIMQNGNYGKAKGGKARPDGPAREIAAHFQRAGFPRYVKRVPDFYVAWKIMGGT